MEAWPRLMPTLLLMAVLAVLAVLANRLLPPHYVLDVVLKADTPPGSSAQIYFSQDGTQFFPRNTVQVVQRLEFGQQSLVGRIYSSKPVRAVRLDPADRLGNLDWYSLHLQGVAAGRDYVGRSLLGLSPTLDQLTVRSADESLVSFTLTGEDAKVVIAVPPELQTQPEPHRQRLRRLVFGVLALAAAASLLGQMCRRRLAGLVNAARRVSARAADWLSDEAVVVFTPRSLLVYGVLLVLAVAWVGLGLNQSSIGVWDGLYGTEPVERSIQLGHPRDIRSDEWSVLTPWMLGQVQTGMAVDNPNLGAPASTILAGVPVKGPLMLAQPKYWGFVLMDVEHGFSWYWAFKTLGLLGAVFTLLLVLTRGDVLVSLAGAVALFGSSLVQWWFSGFAPEMIIGLCVAVVGSLYLLWARKTGGMLAGALAVALVVPNLLMHLYPPHLVPLAYLGAFLVVGLLLSPGSVERLRVRWPLRVAAVAMALVCMGYLVWIWYGATADTVHLMLATVYPGQRAFPGGDMPLYLHFHGVFESWSQDGGVVPFPPGNPTKASRLWVLFPLLVLVVPLLHWFKPSYRVKTALLGYFLLVLCWSSAPLPEPVRNGLAHLGWSMSAPWDSAFGVGVASTLLVSLMVAERARGELAVLPISSWSLALVVFAVVLSYGLMLSTQDPAFFVLGRILLASGVVAAVMWSVHRGHRWLYLAMMVLAAVPSLRVNPLQNGFDQYLHKDIFANAQRLGAGGIWAVYGDLRVAQGFKSAGARVLNGTHFAPRMDQINVLDPRHQAEDIWNRYAHVELISAAPGTEPSFDLMFPDHYQIALDVCGTTIRELGVTHVAYTYPPTAAELTCLVSLQAPVSHPAIRYFRLK